MHKIEYQSPVMLSGLCYLELGKPHKFNSQRSPQGVNLFHVEEAEFLESLILSPFTHDRRVSLCLNYFVWHRQKITNTSKIKFMGIVI